MARIVGAAPQTSEASSNQTTPTRKLSYGRSGAQSATQQEQAGKGEQIPTAHPMEIGHSDLKVTADRRERDAEDGAVESSYPRAEDRDRDHPASCSGRVTELLARRLMWRFQDAQLSLRIRDR